MTECAWFPLCPMKRYYERGALEYRWIEEYCRREWSRCVRFRMEERGEYHPDWMLPDGSLAPGLEGRQRTDGNLCCECRSRFREGRK